MYDYNMSDPVSAANMVLENFWDGNLPVNPVQVTKAMGIQMFFDSNLDVSGRSWIEEDGRRVIHLNPNEPVTRQRFTVFHEIGHLLMHEGSRDRNQHRKYSQAYYDIPEVEANAFAAEVAMPRRLVDFYVMKKEYSLNQLAEKFGVSGVAMSIRLEKLGYV